ncbi:hypothetical protein K503DRAFT_770176 [Rhizopogon vinicolor AM-OR11-026]|uniref:Uncharacterized protein n=1 Tax=Rhizopogon vinicolor AM-OR11-026 TaxID=1314800 RepID=A0A1B7N1H6_9AGAM|nr:hypothetical protein K503DRAFT_770176 [Rhizopogon vinicolor AM-OR11-026]
MSNLPHVFVIPPEEEHSQNPPWCCFDADLPPDNSASIEVKDILLDVPFLLHQSEPNSPLLFDQPGAGPVVTSTPQSKSSSSRTVKRHRPQDIKTSAMLRENDQMRIVRRDVRDDSDVIEVVKVKRTKDHKSIHTDHAPPSPSNPEPQLKRSKTLRARASRALKSIKNVSLSRGKQTNSKPHVKELWTSSESMPGIFRGVLHSQEHVLMPRRKLSGFFHKQPQAEGLQCSKGSDTTSISDIRPSYEFIERPLTPCAPTYDHSLRHPVSSADFQRPPSPESKSSKDLKQPTSSQDLQPSESDSWRPVSSQDFRQEERPTSPSSSTRIPRKRFSVNELHRIFSFSPEPPSSFTSAPTSASASNSSTHSHPDVPYAAAHLADDDYGKEIEGKYGRSFDRSLDLLDGGDDHLRATDASFEMRLDSLHFDSLSFDPEEFDVTLGTMELGISQS